MSCPCWPGGWRRRCWPPPRCRGRRRPVYPRSTAPRRWHLHEHSPRDSAMGTARLCRPRGSPRRERQTPPPARHGPARSRALLHAKSTLGRLDLDRQRTRIVGEVAPPALRGRARDELVAHLDGLDRVVVVGARPAHRDLPSRGNQVAPEDRARSGLARIDSTQQDGLRAAGVATGGQYTNTIHEFNFALYLGQLAGRSYQVELLDLHDPLQSQLVTVRGLALVALDDVAGSGKVWPTVGVHHAAGVVVVQVADGHEVNAVRVDPHGATRA